MLATRKVQQTIRLSVRISGGPSHAEADESGDGSCRGARWTGGYEYNRCPDRCAQPPIERQKHAELQLLVARQYESGDLLGKVNAQATHRTGADELLNSEGLYVAALPAVRLVKCDDEELALA